ncbi:MAG: hypothetical protein ACYC96_01650 [Fimbriimonadaceae bacterium]
MTSSDVVVFKYGAKGALAAAPALVALAGVAALLPDAIKPVSVLWLFLAIFLLLEIQLVLTCVNAKVELHEESLQAVSWLRLRRTIRYDEIVSFGNTWLSDGTGIKVVAPGTTLYLTYPLERLDALRNELRRRCPVRDPQPQ